MAKKNSIVVGLDIGTSKVCAVVGEMTEHGVEIIGVGSHPSQGLRKGVVINIEATVSSLKKAVEEASLMAGCEIHTVFTSLSGGHIKAFNSHGIVAVKNKEVWQRDLERVIDAAKAVAIPMDREVLHVLPQDYIIDDQDGIQDPLGMSGVRLEAKVHIVTGAVTSAQNVIKCCNRSGLNVAEMVLAPLAVAEAVLTEEERELGVVLIDVGGGTTDIAVYHDGTVKHTAVIPHRRQPCHQRYRRRPAHPVQRRRALETAPWFRQGFDGDGGRKGRSVVRGGERRGNDFAPDSLRDHRAPSRRDLRDGAKGDR